MNLPGQRNAHVGAWQQFISSETAPGVLLFVAAILAMVVANSTLAPFYRTFLEIPIVLSVGAFVIDKPLLLWVNDGLMAVFFFLVGLELKRELLEGELSDPRQALLPVAAAIGGIAIPSLIYAAINAGDDFAHRGWAIPAATDIAFALGVLALLGDRVPRGLKVFLLTVAIVDDIGAIIIIAIFYSATPSAVTLYVAGAAMLALLVMNRLGVLRIAPYILIGLVLWAAVLKSGVHATIAGVLLALTIPLRTEKPERSPSRQLERDLHGSVTFAVLPPVPRQAGRYHGGVRCADPGGLGTVAQRRHVGQLLRCCRIDRHRLHDEPVHRQPGVQGRTGGCAAGRRTRRHIAGFRGIGDRRISDPQSSDQVAGRTGLKLRISVFLLPSCSI